jgi:DNA invertase Pin-like site-specific DNA recombinase
MSHNTKHIAAIGYLRTSVASKADDKRRRSAILSYAKQTGLALIGEYSDPVVSGADQIESRSGFSALLDKIESDDVRIVIVEDASSLARDLVTQELAIIVLIRRGVRVLAANGDDLTDCSDESRKMTRHIAVLFVEYEKVRLIAKANAGLARKRKEIGKCGGRKTYAEARPEVVALAKKLRGQGLSYSKISAKLAGRGYLTANGKPYVMSALQTMLGIIGKSRGVSHVSSAPVSDCILRNGDSNSADAVGGPPSTAA